jgi:hypothetical protein
VAPIAIGGAKSTGIRTDGVPFFGSKSGIDAAGRKKKKTKITYCARGEYIMLELIDSVLV